ncbi:hypothetical protein GCM10027053_18450 [Intrasporangium mesophilum]
MMKELGQPEPSLARRLGSKVAELVGEAVVEGLFAVLACAVAGVAITGFIWGWNRHPLATAIASAAMASLLGTTAPGVSGQEHDRRVSVAKVDGLQSSLPAHVLLRVLAVPRRELLDELLRKAKRKQI